MTESLRTVRCMRFNRRRHERFHCAGCLRYGHGGMIGLQVGGRCQFVGQRRPAFVVDEDSRQSSKFNSVHSGSVWSRLPCADVRRGSLDERPVEYASRARLRAEQHGTHHAVESSPEPLVQAGRESPFSCASMIDCGRMFRMAFLDKVLASEASDLEPCGNARRELHHLMIEKRHAALDRRRHAHVVLFHQQFDKIGLLVSVQQPVQEIAVLRRR